MVSLSKLVGFCLSRFGNWAPEEKDSFRSIVRDQRIQVRKQEMLAEETRRQFWVRETPTIA